MRTTTRGAATESEVPAPARSGRSPATTWRLLTPHPGVTDAGAIAAVAVDGDLDAAFPRLGLRPLRVGVVALRGFAGFDRGIAARPAPGSLLLMPHAGPAVLSRLFAWLGRAGITPSAALGAQHAPPRTTADLRSRMLETLAIAASPLAIDLLLDQPRRWAALLQPHAQAAHRPGDAPHPAEHASILRRLIHPPLVVALGPPNIGKSTLVNALAGRCVSIVADQPGTTRDHVGVRLDLGGLVVDYMDAPGITPANPPLTGSPFPAPSPDPHPIQREAQALALHAASAATLLLLCSDPQTSFLNNPCPRIPTLRISLRADLGPPPQPCDLSLSSRAGRGLTEFVTLVREALVPNAILADPRPWTFWD